MPLLVVDCLIYFVPQVSLPRPLPGTKDLGGRDHAPLFHGHQRWKQFRGWNWKRFIKGNVPAGCSRQRLCWRKLFQYTPSCASITNVAPLTLQERGARVAKYWPNQGIRCAFCVRLFVCYILLHAGVQQLQVQTGSQGCSFGSHFGSKYFCRQIQHMCCHININI